jgi:hypothetical protein
VTDIRHDHNYGSLGGGPMLFASFSGKRRILLEELANNKRFVGVLRSGRNNFKSGEGTPSQTQR